MAYTDARKDIPAPGTSNFDARVREALQTGLGKIGSGLDRFVTLRDLDAAGMIALRPGWKPGVGGNPIGGPGPNVDGGKDLRSPPEPTGFSAVAAFSNLFIECDPQTYTMGHGHGESVLYGVNTTAGGPLPTFANAVELATFAGTTFAYPVNPAQTYRLWLKWKTRDGVESATPAGGINGIEVKSGIDVDTAIKALTDAAENPASPYGKLSLRADQIYAVDSATGTNTGIFQIVTAPITNNGVTVPVGVYVRDLYVQNGAITNAKIGNLAVDNAKISNVSVSKLTAGSIAVGQYAQSTGYVSGSAGWRIDGNGNAEFSNAIVRGTVFASAGVFTGTIQANAGYFNGDISGATGTFNGGVRGGSYTGYAWPPSGGQGFYLGPGGLLLGNANDGRYFQVEQNGNLYMPGFNVVNGVATFTGRAIYDAGGGNRLEIDSAQIRVYAGGVLRVIMGVGF